MVQTMAEAPLQHAMLQQQLSPVPYLGFSVAFIIIVHLLHTYLDVRQLKAIQLPSPPAALAGLFSTELFKSSRVYSIDKWHFNFLHGQYNLVEQVVQLYFGFLPWLWYSLPSILPAQLAANEITRSVCFVLLMSAISLLMNLPWSYYNTFVIEERHGFNKQTKALFFIDLAKTVLLGLVLLPPLIGGFTWLLQRAGPWVPLQLWAFFFSVAVVMMTIYPILIAPLFNKFDPLPEGSLRGKIEALAGSLKFPLKKLYQMDGSKRSGHSNAYMYGFFNNKRIVLFDTLIKECSEDEVVAVLAHELGHWKLGHTPINFTMGQLILLANFMLFAAVRNTPGLYESFGFTQDRPALVAFFLFQFLVGPLDEFIGFLTNLVSRRFEYQADRFAVEQGKGQDLRGALLKLEEQNKASLNVDSWFSAYHHSHPHLVERLSAIDAVLKKDS